MSLLCVQNHGCGEATVYNTGKNLPGMSQVYYVFDLELVLATGRSETIGSCQSFYNPHIQ